MRFLPLQTLFMLAFLVLVGHAHSQSLNNIESVEYDPINDQFLISNGNSIIAQDIDSGELSFFGQASATHGMEVMDSILYAIDGSFIKGYALSDASEQMSLNIIGAQFLNGLTNDGNGRLYATDFSKRQIIKIDVSDLGNPSFEVLVQNTMDIPNGIIYEEPTNRLIYVSWGSNASVWAVDLTDNSIATIANTSYTNMDGIVRNGDGNYLISTWSPSRILQFSFDFSSGPTEIPLPSSISNPADIGIAIERDILAIPHYPFSGDEVLFVDIGVGSVSTQQLLDLASLNFSLSPNPVTDKTMITFELERPTDIVMTLFDAQGKKARSLLSGMQPAGSQQLTLNSEALSSGMYYLQIIGNGRTATVPVHMQDR